MSCSKSHHEQHCTPDALAGDVPLTIAQVKTLIIYDYFVSISSAQYQQLCNINLKCIELSWMISTLNAHFLHPVVTPDIISATNLGAQ